MTSIKQEATATRYELQAHPNGKFSVLIFDDPENPKVARTTLDMTEAEVRQILGAVADERLRAAKQGLEERLNRKP